MCGYVREVTLLPEFSHLSLKVKKERKDLRFSWEKRCLLFGAMSSSPFESSLIFNNILYIILFIPLIKKYIVYINKIGRNLQSETKSS